MPLHVVPDPPAAPRDRLVSQIEALSDRVDEALAGDVVEGADALAKLVNALARLIEAQNKREQTVKLSDLTRFASGLSESIAAHVASPEARSNIERDWRRLMKDVGG